MMRSSMILVAALALSGCESGAGNANCQQRDQTLSAPTCRADEKLSVAEPIGGLGIQNGRRANGHHASGTITGVDDTTLYFETERGPFAFRWHGSWPVPVAEGQKIDLEQNLDSDVVTINGRALMVLTPTPLLGSRTDANVLCFEQSLGCRASPLTYGLEFEVRSPFFQAKLPVGQTVQVGEWMVSNPGVVHRPASVCDELVEDIYVDQRFFEAEASGQLLAWTVDRAVLEEDPAWCPGALVEINQWPPARPFGYEGASEGRWLAATVDRVDHYEATRLVLSVDGVSNVFKWPGGLISPLIIGDEVEVAALGEQSALKTTSHLYWIATGGSLPDQTIPGFPDVQYEPGCLLSNASQVAAAVVSWEGESIRLLPGTTGELGPWTVVHHYGTFTFSPDCRYEGGNWLGAITSASRSLED